MTLGQEFARNFLMTEQGNKERKSLLKLFRNAGKRMFSYCILLRAARQSAPMNTLVAYFRALPQKLLNRFSGTAQVK